MNKYYGVFRGIVSNIDDNEKRGRICCVIPDVLGDEESAWCEPCVSVAYDDGGDFCIPQKDETVWIVFEGGDPNKPVYLGNWWRENHTPLNKDYSQKDKVRIINFADCTIMMKDDRIDINVADGNVELSIEKGKVSIKGDLVVEGKITCDSINN